MTPDEPGRLAALRRYDLLDTPPEAGFDDIATLAAAVAGTPVALVSLIDHDRQWFKARVGVDLTGTPREISFCDHAIRSEETMVVLDATADPRFAANPLVTDAPGVRFYAGAPIRTLDGFAIGTVCVLDVATRAEFTATAALEALARQAARLIESRTARSEIAAAATRELDRLWTMSHELMVVTDLEARLLAVNPAWEALFGLLPVEGANPFDYLAPDEDPAPRLPLGTSGLFKRRYIDKSGVIRSVSWTVVRDGERMFAVGRDDTALIEAEDSLRQAQKMEAVGQLTGGIAHDFNNLLTIVLGNLDIVRRRLGEDGDGRVRTSVARAVEGAERAAALTGRLLAFARRQPLDERAITPAALLEAVRQLVERAAGATIDVVIDPLGASWPVRVDSVQLENALINLVVNARDAMPEGGRLEITAEDVPVDAASARRHGAPPGDYVRFSVRDEGQGMSPRVATRAFDPFFTTKGVGKGTGLGLSQVHGFVAQSGGFVAIDSVAGRGTRVDLWLPRSGEEPAAPVVASRPQRIVDAGARVMVVEDNDAVRELVVATLRDAGYGVIEAHDGRSALSLFARQAESPALVISDVIMPGLDGASLAAEIRRRAPATQVLLMTGYQSDAALAGDDSRALLMKPFTADTLLARVDALLTA